MKETTLFQPRIENEATTAKKKKYQQMTWSIMFSMVETRPNISFNTSVANRFAKNFSHQYSKVVKTIRQYIKSSREQEITFGDQEKLLVEGYLDSDWAGNRDNRKSTFGFIFILNRSRVS